MGKPREACPQCQRPRRRPGLCSRCSYEADAAKEPPPKPMSRETAGLLAMIGALGVDVRTRKR